MKTPEPGNEVQRKIDYINYYAITMSRNYYRKLLQKIMSQYIMTQKMWGLQGYWRIQKYSKKKYFPFLGFDLFYLKCYYYKTENFIIRKKIIYSNLNSLIENI